MNHDFSFAESVCITGNEINAKLVTTLQSLTLSSPPNPGAVFFAKRSINTQL